MKPWQRLDDGSDMSRAGFITITHKQFLTNRGATIQADITGADGRNGTAVIALTSDNEVVIARQFRCGPEAMMAEIPGGLVDVGETAEQAARRELLEETGYMAATLEYLGFAWTDAWSSTKHHFFLARDCTYQQVQRLEDTEEIEVKLISIDQLLHNAYSGKMTDAIGVFFAQKKLEKIKEEHETTN